MMNFELICLMGQGNLPSPGSYTSVGWLLLGIAALVAAINQVDDFLARRKDKPSPLDVASDSRQLFATKSECQKVHGGVEQRLNALERMIIENRAESDAGRAKLYDHIDKKMGDVMGSITRVHERVDAIPNQVIAILNNTKVIK